MTNQEIFELMARFDASTATTLKLSTKDFSLELGKGGPAAPIPAAAGSVLRHSSRAMYRQTRQE